MKTDEFKKSCVECLDYAPNEFELDAMLRSNLDISEPWVKNFVRILKSVK